MFSWILKNDSQMRISVLSYFEDSVIGTAFNGLSGPEYKELLTTETDKAHSAYPDRFNRFMLPGTMHVVSTGWPSVTAGGVTVSDWTSAMAKGDASVWTDILATGP
jgi:hypothetical protein